MKTFVKLTAYYNHRLNDYVLDIVKSSNKIFDHVKYYEVYWVTNPYGNLCVDLVWKEQLNKIKQEHGTWDYSLVITEKTYSESKKILMDKMLDIAKNKSVDCFKNTFIDIKSLINKNQ